MAFHWNQQASSLLLCRRRNWAEQLVMVLILTSSIAMVSCEKYHHHSLRKDDIGTRRQLKKKKDKSGKCVEFFHDTKATFFGSGDPYIVSGILNTIDTDSHWTFEKIGFTLTRTQEYNKDVEGTPIKFWSYVGTFSFTVEDNAPSLARTRFTLNCELEQRNPTENPPPNPTDVLFAANCGLSSGTGVFAGATADWHVETIATPPFLGEGKAIVCLAD